MDSEWSSEDAGEGDESSPGKIEAARGPHHLGQERIEMMCDRMRPPREEEDKMTRIWPLPDVAVGHMADKVAAEENDRQNQIEKKGREAITIRSPLLRSTPSAIHRQPPRLKLIP